MNKIINTLIASVFMLCTSFITTVYAGSVNLAWNANSEGDLSGYRLHHGTISGVYPNVIDVGNQTSYTVSGLNPGTYYVSVTAYDLSGNESGYSNEVTVTIPDTSDTTPPVISGISVTNLSSVSATVVWTTDEPASNQVEYGTTSAYGMTTVFNTDFSTNHSVVIQNLTPATLYHYRVINTDVAGNMAVSSDRTFTTQTSSDTTPPGDVLDFSAVPQNQSILLSWTNPADADYAGVRIRFKTDGFPADINDGTLLGDIPGAPGEANSISHTGLNSDLTYYYSASSYDDSGNFQSTVYAAVSPLGTESSIGGGDSSSISASGGCGMINPDIGNPPGPGQAADMVGFLFLLLIGLLRYTLRRSLQWGRKLLPPVPDRARPVFPAGIAHAVEA